MAEDGTGGTGGTGDNGAGGTSWTTSLPENIRGHEALKDIPDVATLTTRYLDTRKPFAEQLPEKIRGEAAFKDIKNLDGLADSYYNAQKLLGVPKDQILRLPTSDKPEDWAPVYDKLGRPTKAEDYKLTLKAGQKAEEQFTKALTGKAHELGVSQKQLDGLFGWFMETSTATVASQQAERDAKTAAAAAALKTEWGAAFDSHLADVSHLVDQLEEKYPGIKKDLEATGAGNSPALAKYLKDQYGSHKEDGFIRGRAGGSSSLQSPAEAQQSIAALKQDQKFMATYLNRQSAGHKEAVAKMEGLYQLAYPSAA